MRLGLGRAYQAFHAHSATVTSVSVRCDMSANAATNMGIPPADQLNMPLLVLASTGDASADWQPLHDRPFPPDHGRPCPVGYQVGLEIATAQGVVAKLETAVPMAQKRETNFKPLVDQGYISGSAAQGKNREHVELGAAGQPSLLSPANAGDLA